MAYIGDYLNIELLEAGTKGDLPATDGSTCQFLSVSGNDGYVLTEDSTETTGLKWAAQSGSSGAGGALLHMGWN